MNGIGGEKRVERDRIVLIPRVYVGVDDRLIALDCLFLLMQR